MFIAVTVFLCSIYWADMFHVPCSVANGHSCLSGALSQTFVSVAVTDALP